METYDINGHQIEYDIWDQINLELFESERKHTLERMDQLENALTDENAISALREICETVRDFFDVILGEGSSDEIFGTRMNAVRESAAMVKFVDDVSKTLAHPPIASSAAQTMNRQQRRERERAAEREKRRMEAAARVAVKNGSASTISNVMGNAL